MAVLIHCQTYAGRGLLSHYYHFFFACLLPLIDYQCQSTAPQQCYLAPELPHMLGPFYNTLIHELRLCKSLTDRKSFQTSFQEITLPSYDIYDNILFANESVPRLNPATTLPHIDQYFSSITTRGVYEEGQPYSQKIILLIERSHDSVNASTSVPHDVKHSSGTARRQIRNHRALETALRRHFEGGEYIVLNECLEGKSIIAQRALFRSAGLVVAQHGAALANMVFMVSGRDNGKESRGRTSRSGESATSRGSGSGGRHVVEISPPGGRRAAYFKNLARHLGLSHSSVLQERNRGKVDVSLVVQHVRCALLELKHRDPSTGAAREGVLAGGAARAPISRICGDAVGDAAGDKNSHTAPP